MAVMRFSRFLLLIVVLLLIGGGVTWFVAGRATPPTLDIHAPLRVIGQKGTLEVSAGAPGARFTRLDILVEQDHKQIPLFSLTGGHKAAIHQDTPDRLRITEPFGKQAVPDLHAGPARLVATASRSVLFGLREISTTVSRDIQVDLTPPLVQVLSTKHYINLGGSEMVVYRVTPPTDDSGVRVGDIEYPGLPRRGRRHSRQRSGTEGGLLRAALRSGSEHADGGLRA